MNRDEILKLAVEEAGADSVRLEGSQCGYEVWSPTYNESKCVGLPMFIFVKGDHYRWVDGEDGLDVLSYLRKTYPEMYEEE